MNKKNKQDNLPFHEICITRTASTVLSLLGISAPAEMAPPIEQVLKTAGERFSPLEGAPACDGFKAQYAFRRSSRDAGLLRLHVQRPSARGPRHIKI